MVEFVLAPPKLRLGVLASHTGTTLQAILDAARGGQLHAEVAVVIGNNSRSRALARAAEAGVVTHHLSGGTNPEPGDLDAAIVRALREQDVEVVVLAGYMKKLGPATLRAFQGRIINTHPALLPKFGGAGMFGENVHRAVLAAGERSSGCTVHLVDAEYDTGAPLAQVEVEVLAGDSVDALSARVQAAEKQLLIGVLEDIARRRIVGTLRLTS